MVDSVFEKRTDNINNIDMVQSAVLIINYQRLHYNVRIYL